MKTAHIAAFAVALTGLAATAILSPAHAGDAEDALDECLDYSPPAFIGFGAVIQLGCYAGYAIETAGDDDEEEDEEDARPYPGIGKQVHVPLTAVPPQHPAASPRIMNQPHMNQPRRPMAGGAKSVGAAALQAPAVKQRPMVKNSSQPLRAQPSAAVKAATATPRRAAPPALRRTR